MTIRIKRCFFAGITFIAPIVVTFWALWFAYNKLALFLKEPFVRFYKAVGLFDVLPRHVMAILAELIFVLLIFLGLTVMGYVLTRYFKRRGDNAIHKMLGQVPVIKTVFNPVKQAVQSLLGEGMDGRQVVRFPYPCEPYTTLGIVMDELVVNGTESLMVMMPLTMSAGTGVLLTIPKSKAVVIDVEASQALAHVISCGMVKLGEDLTRVREGQTLVIRSE